MNEDFPKGFLFGVIIMCFILGASLSRCASIEYKNGQVDCLTGDVKYKLVENKDGTRSWELK